MNIKELILNRRTIHNYNEKTIDQKVINNALDCFLHAPNHKHTQPWKILTATKEQRKTLCELNIKLKLTKKSLSEIEKIAIQKKMMNPSHLMVILQKNIDNSFQSKEDYAAISCAIMNMQLYFWSESIGCKWSSGLVTYHDETYETLEIDKNIYTIVGFNWAGYFDRTPPKPQKQNITELLIS